ncbi:TPA: hypothetical protein ACQ0CD_001949 [Streptococcus agalactiae]|nr:hypothetical protein [Streptococcus agalactiae]
MNEQNSELHKQSIVDADSIGFVYHGEYETWHFKLLNTEAN